MPKKRIVVLGFMANCPIAGVIWQMVHYVVGLQRLGHEVYYVEDLSRVPYDPVRQTVDEDDAYAVATLGRLADEFGFQGRWGFCSRFLGRERTFGLSRAAIDDLYKNADALLNICGSHELNDDLLQSENLIYVESDPGVEQIKVDTGDAATLAFLRRHRALFTFGEAIAQPGSAFPVPLHGLTWHPTRQPVVTDFWRTDAPPAAGAAVFTTIANLATGGKKDIAWRGENYLWSKLPEFERFRDAPARAGEPFELATTFKDPALAARFHAAGWRDTSPEALSIEWRAYVAYVRGSKGEFTVAKDQYVRLRTGWFSDRSACYLAAGRPVITQATGFTDFYGDDAVGLFAFTDLDEIAAAVRAINADYARHSRAASDLAREFFEAETVLSDLLERAGI